MPPKSWDKDELKLAGAMDTGPTRPPNLDGRVHSLFTRENWAVIDEDYELLRPSMRLASNLIQIGMPYIATFLPSDHHIYKDGEDWPDTIQHGAIKVSDLTRAREELEEISKFVEWQRNDEIAKDFAWCGITRLINTSRPWGPLDFDSIDAEDAFSKEQGKDRRPLVVGIMGEYVEALKAHPPNTEQHLRAAFFAAITMTHEIGHVIFHQDFRSLVGDTSEPHVDKDHKAELGLAFISWIFAGWHPEICELSKKKLEFEYPLYWTPILKLPNPRTPYNEGFSIANSYMENMFTQSFWDGLGDPLRTNYNQVRSQIRPKTSRASSEAATAMIRQWHVDPFGDPKWFHSCKDRGTCLELKEVLSAEEIDLAIREKKAEDEQNDGAKKSGVSYAIRDDEDSDGGNFYGPRTFGGFGGFWGTGGLGNFEADTDDDEDFGAEGFGDPPRQGTSGRANSSADDTDDDEDFGFGIGMQRPRNRSPPIERSFGADIDDGFLEQDLPPKEGEQQKSDIIDVEVRYLPFTRESPSGSIPKGPAGRSPKRGRSEDDDEDEDDNGRGAKRSKLGSGFGSSNLRGLGSSDRKNRKQLFNLYSVRDDGSADDIIAANSPIAIERRFTHTEADVYCKINEIRSVPFQPHVNWQSTAPDSDNPEDMALMQRIKQQAYYRAMERFEKETDLDSLLKLKRDLLISVQYWDVQYLKDHCKDQGLPVSGTRDTLERRVKNWFRDDIEQTIQQLSPTGSQAQASGSSKGKESAPDAGEDKRADDPTYWKDEDFASFFRFNNLPDWGTRKGKIDRVLRFRSEKKNGPTLRGARDIKKRTDPNGWEVYKFKANPYYSSVAALESAVFIAGRFPTDSVIKLKFRGGDFVLYGGADKQLSFYGGFEGGWEDVRVTLEAFAGFKAIEVIDLTDEKEPPVYKPRGQSFSSTLSKGSGSSKSGPVDLTKPRRQSSSSSSSRKRPKAPTIKLEPDRETIGGILQNVIRTGGAIQRAMQPGGGRDLLRPHLRNQQSGSAVEILDNLEDLEDKRRVRGDNFFDFTQDDSDEGDALRGKKQPKPRGALSNGGRGQDDDGDEKEVERGEERGEEERGMDDKEDQEEGEEIEEEEIEEEEEEDRFLDGSSSDAFINPDLRTGGGRGGKGRRGSHMADLARSIRGSGR